MCVCVCVCVVPCCHLSTGVPVQCRSGWPKKRRRCARVCGCVGVSPWVCHLRCVLPCVLCSVCVCGRGRVSFSLRVTCGECRFVCSFIHSFFSTLASLSALSLSLSFVFSILFAFFFLPLFGLFVQSFLFWLFVTRRENTRQAATTTTTTSADPLYTYDRL